jgi:cell division protein FtsA
MAQFICGLNLRTDRLAASLARIDNHVIKEVYSDYCLNPGVDKKGVTDISLLIDSVKDLTERLKNSFVDTKISNIFVSLDSVFVRKATSSAIIPLLERGNKIINNFDIKRLVSNAKAFVQRFDEEIIYNTPLYFVVDDQIITKNPLGLYAHKLEIKLLCIIASRSLLDNITYAFRCAGLDVAGFLYAPLSSSLNIEEERRRSCALIDFGEYSTDVVLFKDGLLEDIEILKTGSRDITQAIAGEFDISSDLAQELRDDHTVLDIDSEDSDEVLIRKPGGYQPIRRVDLARVVTSSFIKKLENIKGVLLNHKHLQPFDNLFATGEDVLLDGFLEIVSREMNTSVNMISGANNLICRHKGNHQLYSSSLGAIKLALSDYNNRSSLPLRGRNLVKKGLVYVKDLYQEYF